MSSSCVPMVVLPWSTWTTSPMTNCASPLTKMAYGRLKSFLMMLMGPSSILISHLMAMMFHTLFTLTKTIHSTIQPSQMVDGRLRPAHHLSLKYPARLPRKQRLCLTVHLFPLMQLAAQAAVQVLGIQIWIRMVTLILFPAMAMMSPTEFIQVQVIRMSMSIQ